MLWGETLSSKQKLFCNFERAWGTPPGLFE